MAIPEKEAKELWVQFALGAVANYTVPESIDDADEQVDDMAEIASKFADAMMDEYEERFAGGPRRGRKIKRPKREEPEEPDPDLEDDE